MALLGETIRVTITGPAGHREMEALAKNLPELVLDAELSYFQYDPELDVFFFSASKATQRKNWQEGFCLSIADAEAGAWKTIYEPPSF